MSSPRRASRAGQLGSRAGPAASRLKVRQPAPGAAVVAQLAAVAGECVKLDTVCQGGHVSRGTRFRLTQGTHCQGRPTVQAVARQGPSFWGLR